MNLCKTAVGNHEEWERYRGGILSETVEKNQTAYGASGYSPNDSFGIGASIEASFHMSEYDDDLQEEGDGSDQYESLESEWQAEAPPVKDIIEE